MYFYHSYNLYKKFERILLYYIIRKQKFSFFFLFHTKRKHLYSGYKFRYDFGVRVQGSWLKREGSSKSGAMSKEWWRGVSVNRPWPWSRAASCPVHFAKDLRLRTAICSPSLSFLLHSPYHLTLASSFSLRFSSLSLSICFTIALAGSVIPIPDLYNTISTDRVSHCLAQDAFDSTPSDHFILVSFSFFLFPLSCDHFSNI